MHMRMHINTRARHGHAPPCAPDGLLLECRVDAGLQQEHVVGGSEVDAHLVMALRCVALRGVCCAVVALSV
jgi:hypothetical protein